MWWITLSKQARDKRLGNTRKALVAVWLDQHKPSLLWDNIAAVTLLLDSHYANPSLHSRCVSLLNSCFFNQCEILGADKAYNMPGFYLYHSHAPSRERSCRRPPGFGGWHKASLATQAAADKWQDLAQNRGIQMPLQDNPHALCVLRLFSVSWLEASFPSFALFNYFYRLPITKQQATEYLEVFSKN